MGKKDDVVLPLEEHLNLLINIDDVACDETTQPISYPEKHEKPEWYDEKKFRRGQQFYYDNIFAMFVGKLAGLIAVLAVPSILKILIFTKQSSTVETAYRRYVATILHMHSWYANDFSPGSSMWRSLAEVRYRHHSASRRSAKNNTGRITQRDMALTQFGFFGFIITKPKMIGINMTQEDLEGFVHFWRVIGWILGIDDKYNLCRQDAVETLELCNQLREKYFAEMVRSTEENFVHMYTVLLKGMWYINPLIYVNPFMDFVFRASEPEEKNDKIVTPSLPLTNFEKNLIAFMTYLLKHLFAYTLVRMYFNYQMRLVIFLIHYFPFLAFFSFGIKNSYARLYEHFK